jgi:serine/threonine protein kinase
MEGRHPSPARAHSPPRPPAAKRHHPPPPTSGALLERVESRAYSEAYIAGLVRSILRFIAQCHAKGIVYRDVKPGAALGGGQ